MPQPTTITVTIESDASGAGKSAVALALIDALAAHGLRRMNYAHTGHELLPLRPAEQVQAAFNAMNAMSVRVTIIEKA